MAEIKYDPSLEEVREKWASEIGRFVMAFGTMEGVTYNALRRFLQDPIAPALIDANMGLKNRIDVLVAIAESKRKKQWDEFASLLKEVKILAGKRNLIAHNGVQYDIYIDALGNVSVEDTIRNNKKKSSWHEKTAPGDRVAFEDLVRHRKKAEQLSASLIGSMISILALMGAEQTKEMDISIEDHGQPPQIGE